MNKKLLIAGCSHSAGFGLKENELSWSELFSIEYGYNVTNIAHPGSSLLYSINKICNELYQNCFDLVFLQLTDFARISIGIDGEKSFLSNKFLLNDNLIEHITLGEYLNAVDKNKENLKFIYEKVLYSTFNLEQIINALFLLQSYCKSKDINLVMIPYDDQNWGYNSNYSIWSLDISKKINKKNYIDYPFLQWLREKYNPEDFFIDNGFHLNREGQKLFTYEYLIPQLKKLEIPI